MRVDDLYGDRAAERFLLGAIHAAHPTHADEIEDHVPARKRSSEQRVVGFPRQFGDRKTADWAELVGLLARVRALRADNFRHVANLPRRFGTMDMVPG